MLHILSFELEVDKTLKSIILYQLYMPLRYIRNDKESTSTLKLLIQVWVPWSLFTTQITSHTLGHT